MLIVAEIKTCPSLLASLGKRYARIAFERLLQAYLDGLHVLVFPPMLCNAIEADSTFSVDVRAAAKKIRQKYAEHGGLSEKMSVFGYLVDESAALHPMRTGQTWKIPLRWLAIKPLHETYLVAEDLHDVRVLTAAAVDYLNHQRLFAFRVRVCPTPGGGLNTARTFAQKAKDEQHLTICFADSDKDSPTGPVGSTAKKCQEVTGAGLYDVRLTAGRSLENALPWQLLDLLRRNSNPAPSVALKSVEAAAPGTVRFANLKRGMFTHDIHRLDRAKKAACATFWTAARTSLGYPSTPACCPTVCNAPDVGSCSERFVSGFGNATLADAEKWFAESTGNTSRQSAYMSSSDAAEWIAIGGWVAEYSLGMQVRRL